MSSNDVLPILDARMAIMNAKKTVDEGRSTENNYLRTPWDGMNKALFGGFRWGDLHVLAGGSGVGKSFLLNMIMWGFLNPKLNNNHMYKFKILYFSMEMSAGDEILRRVSTKTGLSYAEIVSGTRDLEDTEYESILATLRELNHPDLYFVEKSGTIKQIDATYRAFKKMFPDHKILVAVDHSLLAEYEGEKDEVSLVSNFARQGAKWKKNGDMVIMISQLNDKIEDPRRIENPSLHYPKKTDIHGSKAVYFHADFIIALHAPEMIGIEKYGPKGFETKDLIACHFLKVRKAVPGLLRLKRMLGEGKIVQWKD